MSPVNENPNRPKPPKKPPRNPITIRISETGEQALADFARKHEITFSEAARMCIAAGLQHLS